MLAYAEVWSPIYSIFLSKYHQKLIFSKFILRWIHDYAFSPKNVSHHWLANVNSAKVQSELKKESIFRELLLTQLYMLLIFSAEILIGGSKGPPDKVS